MVRQQTSPQTSQVPHAKGAAAAWERKRARMRAHIIQAATELFTEHGYDQVSVEDIAAAVDISPRTFFRYFAGKDEVVRIPHVEAAEQFAELLAARPKDEPLADAIENVLQEMSAMMTKRRPIAPLFRLVEATPALAARRALDLREVERAWASQIATRLSGRPDAEWTAAVLAAALVAAMIAALDRWAHSDEGLDLGELVSGAIMVLRRGLDCC
ncbi:TetR family transcriptional regulator [Streptomyces puniciscabiei]